MANLNIRVDDKLKKQAEEVFSELGISLTTATTMFLKQVVRCNGIPFELCATPHYTKRKGHRLAAKDLIIFIDEDTMTPEDLAEEQE